VIEDVRNLFDGDHPLRGQVLCFDHGAVASLPNLANELVIIANRVLELQSLLLLNVVHRPRLIVLLTRMQLLLTALWLQRL
jgi:hypothetical protein